jgi:hypothetical protein
MGNRFLGNDHFISLGEAKKMIEKFRKEKNNIVKTEYSGKDLILNCESFDRAAFDAILQREDCKGVRIYYGMKEEDLRIHAIIVGFDAEGKDILPSEVVMDSPDARIVDKGLPCPTYCPDGGLNP